MGLFFFFQAEDGIRDAQESRGLGDVYKRQIKIPITFKKILFAMIGYLMLLPAVIYLAISTRYDYILYIYLIPVSYTHLTLPTIYSV